MSPIRTHYTPLAELPTPDDAAAARWLSPAERRRLAGMRAVERRATWLAGRVAAKQLLEPLLAERGHETPEPASIDIPSADARGGQRPVVHVAGRSLACSLSIAHTGRGVLVALDDQPGVTLGVDLVAGLIGGRALHTLDWCFSPAERRWLAAAPVEARRAEQLWAMKEALYKAAQAGEGFAPRQIELADGAPRYAALDPARRVRTLQCWRVDGQAAALAVVEPAESFAPAGFATFSRVASRV